MKVLTSPKKLKGGVGALIREVCVRAWSQVVLTDRCPRCPWPGGASALRITSGRLLPAATFAQMRPKETDFGETVIFLETA